MAGQFDLPSWLTTQTPWSGSDAFIKGSQAGAAIAANRLRAKQLYVEVQEHQQRMDLAEREQATRSEASNLHNEVIRTKLANDSADFESLRKWWPEFQKSDGDISPPPLYNETTMLKVSTEIAAKRSKVGMAKFAEFMAKPGRDLSKPEEQAEYYGLMAQYQNIPDKLGQGGVMAPIKMAEDLKRLRDEANSRITNRTEGTSLEQQRLDVSKGNLEARQRENEGKETRLGLRERYLNERNAVNSEEKGKLKAIESAGTAQTAESDAAESDRLRKFYNLKRREVTRKFYGPNPTAAQTTPTAAAVAQPAPVAPGTNRVSVVSPDGKPGSIPESQLEEALKAGYKRP